MGSRFHPFSFARIGALALTQFSKVIVLDNDMTLLQNIDELAELAPTPAMVWHTATVLPKKERCAVTGGLFVLRPNRTEFERALHHLYHELNAGSKHRCYDGSDQEFWRSFYRPIYELPLRYHAHQNLRMDFDQWQKIRLMHSIAGFSHAGQDKSPLIIRSKMMHCRRKCFNASDPENLSPHHAHLVDDF